MRPTLLLPLALLVSCGPKASAPPPSPAAEPAPAAGPALVVYLVVDQLPVRLLEAAQPHFEGGLARLTGAEAWKGVSRYAHAITFTCPGHATLSTGAAPSAHGIVSNDWYVGGEPVYCGEIEYLRAEPVADRFAAAGGTVASLSIKDRGAIMLGGHQAAVVGWYDKETSGFIGADWLTAGIDVASYLDATWEPLFADAYAERFEDDQPWENDAMGEGDVTFPHPAPSHKTFIVHPAAGTALTDAAILGVDRLSLGKDGATDLLTVSYSHTDYIGHNYTAESWEAIDALVRLDRDLGRLFAHLDEAVGDGAYTVVLSSDHGACPHTDDRLAYDDVVKAAEEALAAQGVEGTVLFEDPGLWLPASLRDDPEAYAKATRAVADAVSALPGIAKAYPWRLDDGIPADDPHAEAVRLSLEEERSGDLYVLLGEEFLYDFPGSEGRGTSHGTPYDYDARVPLLAWGAGVKPGQGTSEPDVRRIVPTIAALGGVEKPADAELEPVGELLE